jgi:RNA polymerase sigma-70 factor, ECF subfamily
MQGIRMAMSDKELLVKYRKGDVDALERLVERHRRVLFNFILNMTRNNDDAEDVFQDVWFKVIRKLEIYTEQNFCGWLMKIARNTVIDKSRKRKPEVSLDEESEQGGSLLQAMSAKGPGPMKEAAAGELGDRIRRAADSLPAEQKEVFVMRVQSELSFKEIAKIQGVSINTALARMQYALAKLRTILEDDYKEVGS